MPKVKCTVTAAVRTAPYGSFPYGWRRTVHRASVTVRLLSFPCRTDRTAGRLEAGNGDGKKEDKKLMVVCRTVGQDKISGPYGVGGDGGRLAGRRGLSSPIIKILILGYGQLQL